MYIRAITDKHRSEALTRLLPASRSKFAKEFAPWLERQRYPILFPDARNGGHNGQIHRDVAGEIADRAIVILSNRGVRVFVASRGPRYPPIQRDESRRENAAERNAARSGRALSSGPCTVLPPAGIIVKDNGIS